MKRFTLLLAVTLAVMQAFAANVDRATAQQKAVQFLKSQVASGKFMSSPNVKFTTERTIYNHDKINVPVFYIFNTEDRFVIVSGEDRGEEILAVGDAPIDLNNIPSNMQYWMDRYQEQIEYLQAHPGLVVKTESQSLKGPNRAQSVSPLLTARWDQTSPYWNQCVFNGTQCLTGCPATSLAQVFYYWKFPTAATPSISGYSTGGYTIPALSSTTFDWANMKDSYGWGSTNAQKAAVATLMRYIGQAEHMEYGPDGSGISSSRTSLISDACKTFGYDNNVHAIYKQTAYGTNIYNDATWGGLIQTELTAGRPIVYCGLSNNAGHAFNVDGYTASTNKYHINWGWSGSGNGDFALNAFTDYDGETYNQYQSMVIGIQPPGGQVTIPVLTVEPDSLDFGTVKMGQSVTHTFHVSGTNLLGDISFTRNGNANFSVTPSSLTAAEVEAGATITVTYAPQTTGSHTANIIVEGGAAESHTVVCTGNCPVLPTITATPSVLNFDAAVGETVTQDFNLKGFNLTGAVYLAVVNATSGSGFTINKSNVTKNTAMAGIAVTVTYKPTAPGNHSAQVMLRSAGADTIYVTLNGTATVATYTPVMQPANESYITQTSFRASWTDQTAASAVTGYTLQYETGGEANTVSGITTKYYTLSDLIAGATYSYKVKALYFDGSESAWSNTQQVTLLPAAPAFEVGDVNHDGGVNIADVTNLIDYLLDNSVAIYTDCADINGDGDINIADVAMLIDSLLGS